MTDAAQDHCLVGLVQARLRLNGGRRNARQVRHDVDGRRVGYNGSRIQGAANDATTGAYGNLGKGLEAVLDHCSGLLSGGGSKTILAVSAQSFEQAVQLRSEEHTSELQSLR